MMKKSAKAVFLTMLCTGLCASVLTGCKEKQPEDTQTKAVSDTEAQTKADSPDAAACSYTINDTVIVVGEDFQGAYAVLGEPDDYLEAASCYYDGMDKVFTYEGFEVRTYPKGDADYVQDICISDASYQTKEGITIGSSLEEVIAAYGEDYELNGKMYRYYFDDTHYQYFFMMDDAVKYFGYAVDASN